VESSESVISEAVYVLSSRTLYNREREEVRLSLSAVIELPGLHLPGKEVCLRALDLYGTTTTRWLDFVECLCVAHMEDAGIETIFSFDRGFDSVPGIARQEP